MPAYYNEHDPKAAAWLRELIRAGLIAPGDVDERSIEDVLPTELAGYRQCHFFAGIGGWSYALRLAGIPDDYPVWTGSCPCQPFSAAGKRDGFADERHLWPAFHHLIGVCRPAIVFGEQVAGGPAGPWIDLVQTDLEALGYACGAAAFPACSVGAPHIRQRLYWVAHASGERRQQERGSPLGDEGTHGWRPKGDHVLAGGGEAVGMAHTEHAERWPFSLHREDGRDGAHVGRQETHGEFGARCEVCVLENSEGQGGQRQAIEERRGLHHAAGPSQIGELGDTHDKGPQGRRERGNGTDQRTAGPSSLDGFWRDAEWIWCRDGKYRPVEPGTFPLAHGVSNRVVKLRGYGNAIVPEQAAAFIQACMRTMA